MELRHEEQAGMRGRVVMRAYPAGLLPWLMRCGMEYDRARHKAAEWVEHTVESDNIIVTSGKVLVAQMLMEETGYDTGITYFAIGTDSTTPVVGDTALGTESARLTITSTSRTVNAVTFSTFFTVAQSTYNIKECGLFGHSTAGAGSGSGELFNHAAVAFDNSGGSYDLTFDVVITFG